MANVGYVIFRVLTFVIVFGSLLFLAYITTRYIGRKTNRAMKGKYISTIETVSLGIDKQLHLLKVGNEFVLVSSSGKNIGFLTVVNIEDYKDDVGIEDTGVAFDFKSIFDKYLVGIKDKSNNGYNQINDEGIKGWAEGDVFRSNLNKLKTITTRIDNQDKVDGDDNTDEK